MGEKTWLAMANGKIFCMQNGEICYITQWWFCWPFYLVFFFRKACPKDFEYFDTIDDLGSLKVVKLWWLKAVCT
jgi:hypothetical protein